MYASPRLLSSKFFVCYCLFLIGFPSMFWWRGTSRGLSAPYRRPPSPPVPQLFAHGDSRCLPEVSAALIEAATAKRAKCRKYSPFASARWRTAIVTAQFGEPKEHYQVAFQTHLFHSLVHGTEVRVLCDSIVDDLWNKPAFILNLLMREMLKPAKQRLEWIQWVDGDTLVLDQCRPISSFLPPAKERRGSWWRHGDEEEEPPQANASHLVVTEDANGLNNGVFLLRVNSWAVELFTAILAFRHYKPKGDVPFTEQSAMRQVLGTSHFKEQTSRVPQHWFNAYAGGGAQLFEEREDAEGLEQQGRSDTGMDEHARYESRRVGGRQSAERCVAGD